jgi:hypothetical protein
MTAAKKRLARRRPRASQIAVRQANGLVAEVEMVVCMVMAVFFNEWPRPLSLPVFLSKACCQHGVSRLRCVCQKAQKALGMGRMEK